MKEKIFFTPQNEGQLPEKKRSIGKDYDRLLAEKKELEAKLKQKEKLALLASVIIDPEAVDDATAEEIYQLWMEKLKSETAFLLPYEMAGIDITGDDLSNQPQFPKTTITFNSKEIVKENVKDQHSRGGTASPGTANVIHPQFNNRTRMGMMIGQGRLGNDITTLHHELIHQLNVSDEVFNLHHWLENESDSGKKSPFSPKQTDEIVDRAEGKDPLDEGQAYFGGMFTEAKGTEFSFGQTIQSMKDSRLYFHKDKDYEEKLLESFNIVADLYALGLTTKEISQLIADSEYDPQEKTFQPIAGIVKSLRKKHKIDEIGIQALRDIFKLRITNEQLKARLALLEVVEKKFSFDELVAKKKQMVSSSIGVPKYNWQGKPFPAEQHLQSIICPVNEKYPYDPAGVRTGIVFGFFPQSGAAEEVRIGRIEIGEGDARLDLAKGKKKQEEFLQDVSRQADQMNLGAKKYLFSNMVSVGVERQPLYLEIFKRLTSPEERAEIVGERTDYLCEHILPVIELEIRKVANGFNFLSKGEFKNFAPHVDKVISYLKSILGWAEVLEVLELSRAELVRDSNLSAIYGHLFKIIRGCPTAYKREHPELEKAYEEMHGWFLAEEKRGVK